MSLPAKLLNHDHHRTIRLHFESGMFFADFAECMSATVEAYDRLEFLEQRSSEILQVLQFDNLDSEGERRFKFEERMDRFEKMLEKSLSRDYPDRWFMYLEFLRELRYEGLDYRRRPDLAFDEFRLSFLRGDLYKKPKGYKPKPENALILSRCQINSPGFSDAIGIGKLGESIVKEVGDRKVKAATANKLNAEAESIRQESKRKDRDQDSKDELSQVECAIKKAELMKAQASALKETYDAMIAMGFSEDQAREFIAKQIESASRRLSHHIEKGTLTGIESLSLDSGENQE